jgi:hypothetical protein
MKATYETHTKGNIKEYYNIVTDSTDYVDNYQDVMLTTLDNPFSPHDSYDNWLQYDERLGYDTDKLLARLIGSANSDLLETPLGKEIEDKFYYSTIVDIVHNVPNIPYVLTTPGDYRGDGSFKLYLASANKLINRPFNI